MSRFVRRLDLLAALGVALVVVLAGAVYVGARPATYRSDAQLVLTPRQSQPAERANLIESFERSAIVGTMVELLSAESVRNGAGDPPGTLQVRAIPSSRVVTMTLTGGPEVSENLERLVVAGLVAQRQLHDPWLLRRLDAPSQATAAGPSGGALMGAVLALALLAGLATRVGIGRLLEPPSARAAEGEQEPRLREVASR